MRRLLLALPLALWACGEDPPVEPAGALTAILSFEVTDSVRSNLTDRPLGAVYGQIFLKEDVSLTGPRTGAMVFGDIEATGVDVRTAMTSTASWTSGKLSAATDYVFLGFFDVDRNGAQNHDPDAGDPVTLPGTNTFKVYDTEAVKVRIKFDLIYN